MYLLEDNMKKERKLGIFPMIFSYSLALLTPFSMLINKNKEYEIIGITLVSFFFFFLGCIGLYLWLYALKYKLKITEYKVILKTLFRKTEVNLQSIKNYTCKRYRKSVFYQFYLFFDDKKVIVSTRYKDELIKILKDNNILEKS